MSLYSYYEMNNKPQFCRFGTLSLTKGRQYPDFASFFTQLNENNVYAKNEVLSVIGFLKIAKCLTSITTKMVII